MTDLVRYGLSEASMLASSLPGAVDLGRFGSLPAGVDSRVLPAWHWDRVGRSYRYDQEDE